jgi:hypothetical protein
VDEEVGREGVEEKGYRKGKGRKEKKKKEGRGEEFGPPPPDLPDRSTPQQLM